MFILSNTQICLYRLNPHKPQTLVLILFLSATKFSLKSLWYFKMLSMLLMHTKIVTIYQWYNLSQYSPDNWLTAVNVADESWGWDRDGNRQGLPWSTGLSSAPPWRDRLDRGWERGRIRSPWLTTCLTWDHLLGYIKSMVWGDSHLYVYKISVCPLTCCTEDGD